MKLISKINRHFLFLLLFIFSISGFALYFALNYFVEENLDDILEKRGKAVVAYLHEHPLTTSEMVSPDQSIKITSIEKSKTYCDFSDTTVYSISEDENVICRKISMNKSVNNRDYNIEVLLSRMETEDLIELVFYFLLGLFLVIAVSLYLLNQKISVSVWRPFFLTIEKLKEFKTGQNKKIVLEKSSILEFQQLNGELEKLFEKIQDDFKNLKEFTENASHEIQTPLAIIRAKTESLLADENLTSDQSQQLQVIFKTANRLSKLNEALLLLSKIENRQFVETQNINFNQIIKEKIDFAEELLLLKKLQITIEQDQPFFVEMNFYLAEILIYNLLSNAIRYSEENSEIKVYIETGRVIFANTGRPLNIEKEKIFNRFIKDNSKPESIGLGLSIVYEICTNYNLRIEYLYKDKYHFFIISRNNQI